MKHVIRFEGVIVVDPKVADDILSELEKIALTHGGELNEIDVIEPIEVED
jgi:hypothetical protein